MSCELFYFSFVFSPGAAAFDVKLRKNVGQNVVRETAGNVPVP